MQPRKENLVNPYIVANYLQGLPASDMLSSSSTFSTVCTESSPSEQVSQMRKHSNFTSGCMPSFEWERGRASEGYPFRPSERATMYAMDTWDTDFMHLLSVRRPRPEGPRAECFECHVNRIFRLVQYNIVTQDHNKIVNICYNYNIHWSPLIRSTFCPRNIDLKPC